MTNNELAARLKQMQTDLVWETIKSEKLSAELDYLVSDEYKAEIEEHCRQAREYARRTVRPYALMVIASMLGTVVALAIAVLLG